MYYIDPNGGSALDAIEVYCDFEDGEKKTCVLPETSEVKSTFFFIILSV